MLHQRQQLSDVLGVLVPPLPPAPGPPQYRPVTELFYDSVIILIDKSNTSTSAQMTSYHQDVFVSTTQAGNFYSLYPDTPVGGGGNCLLFTQCLFSTGQLDNSHVILTRTFVCLKYQVCFPSSPHMSLYSCSKLLSEG